MIGEPLEEAYFKWLATHVVNVRLKNPRLAFWNVLRQLFSTEFTWSVRNDDNRVEEGKELRSRFLAVHPEFDNGDRTWLSQGCSFLEMLVALSGRLAFHSSAGTPVEWFWHILDNVGLRITDENYDGLRMGIYVDQMLTQINNRTYERNGRGGLFPLHSSQIDQTKVEIWSQMNYYLIERS